MAQSAADRRRAQRRLAKEIKAGQFKPSPIGRRSREITREQRRPPTPTGPDRITSLRDRVKDHKRGLWGDYLKFKLNSQKIDSSTEFQAMEQFLGMGDTEAADLLSSFATAVGRNGLEAAIEEFGFDWSFLFYH
jgi:hypothetical protein